MMGLKQLLRINGILDERELFCYATVAGTQNGKTMQTLVGCIFQQDALCLYHAKLNGTLGDLLISYPYSDISNFTLKNRFWYSCCNFLHRTDHVRFYNYDKNVFLAGFRDAGMME